METQVNTVRTATLTLDEEDIADLKKLVDFANEHIKIRPTGEFSPHDNLTYMMQQIKGL